MKTLNLGNNETKATGVFKETDGSFTAMTYCRSKNFKTEAGAKKWLNKAIGK